MTHEDFVRKSQCSEQIKTSLFTIDSLRANIFIPADKKEGSNDSADSFCDSMNSVDSPDIHKGSRPSMITLESEIPSASHIDKISGIRKPKDSKLLLSLKNTNKIK